MSAVRQIKLNLKCFIKDAFNLNWRKMRFHWQGLKRGLQSLLN